MKLQAPFPWFGGKSRVASLVWERFGDVPSYVEPFFGSGANLLGRPHEIAGQIETVNDLDGYVANFWRATKSDPEAVAFYADNPVNENDLHARHVWLVERRETLRANLDGDPDFYDAKVAGWWCWGLCCWIGSGFCSGSGPWQSVEVDGLRQLVKGDKGRGVNRKRAHLGNKGQGVNRQLAHLGNKGRGVNRKLAHLGTKGQGVNRKREPLLDWFAALAERLRNVRVCSGDWSRICGPTPTVKVAQPCGVFLDPPYADTATRTSDLYTEDSLSVAHEVREWAIEHGDDPRYRIALCGYEGEHELPESWDVVEWKAKGGYGSQASHDNPNARRERIWFSPHCLQPAETGLFAGMTA